MTKAYLSTLSALLALVGVGCRQQTAAAPVVGAIGRSPIQVRTAPVTRTGENGETSVPGAVQARQRASLSARLPASVIALPYDEGQSVLAGAVVVRLDDTALKAGVAAAAAGLAAAESDLARAEALLKKNAATPRELEEQTSRVAVARAQLAGAKDNLSYCVLRAPFSGRIAVRGAHLGDVVNPGMPLIEIEGQAGLELRATVESELAARLAPGAKVKALVDGQPGPLVATLTALAPSGDPTTHRFEVKADLPSAPGLRAGLFGRLLITGGGGESRLEVPAAAVFERGGLSGVFVVSGGQVHLRWVAVGAKQGDMIEVRAGVTPHERVVIAPSGLADGAAVREQL